MFQVSLNVQPHTPWRGNGSGKQEFKFTILASKINGQSSVLQNLVQIQSASGPIEKIVERLRRDREIIRLNVVKTKNDTAFGSLMVKDCPVCRAVAESDCFLLEATTNDGESMDLSAIIDGKTSFMNLLERLTANGVRVTIRRQQRISGRSALTSRQNQVIKYALEKGYFDYPRSINLGELARTFEVSAATLSELLRRSQKRLFSDYFSKHH